MELIKEKSIGDFLFSTDKRKIDLSYVHDFLTSKSYWAQGISLHTVEKSVENSLAVGVYENENLRQIGFARVVTDYATFGYLADVFIDEAHRGKGLSKNLMEFILSIDEMKVLRRIILGTRDAHSLYLKYGFNPFAAPERFMELHRPDIYKISES